MIKLELYFRGDHANPGMNHKIMHIDRYEVCGENR